MMSDATPRNCVEALRSIELLSRDLRHGVISMREAVVVHDGRQWQDTLYSALAEGRGITYNHAAPIVLQGSTTISDAEALKRLVSKTKGPS